MPYTVRDITIQSESLNLALRSSRLHESIICITMARQKSDTTLRCELAEMAARMMAVDGVPDYLTAKKKAAGRLGITQARHLPSNREIEAALINYQRLFQSDSQPRAVRQLRETALEAMNFFHSFQPYLTGAVLKGTANTHSTVHLIIYTDSPEDLDRLLMDHQIPYELVDRSVKFKPEIEAVYPGYQFMVRDKRIALTVFPFRKRNHSPLSPTDGKPMQRANTERVKRLIFEDRELL